LLFVLIIDAILVRTDSVYFYLMGGSMPSLSTIGPNTANDPAPLHWLRTAGTLRKIVLTFLSDDGRSFANRVLLTE